MPVRIYSSLPPEAFLRLPEVVALVGLKRSTIYEQIQLGKFPPPEKLTLHASGWRVGHVMKWLDCPGEWRGPASGQGVAR